MSDKFSFDGKDILGSFSESKSFSELTKPIEENIATSKMEKKLIIGTVPSMYKPTMDNVWEAIGPHVKELAEKIGGEYTEWSVFNKIYFGHAQCYVAYWTDEKEDIAAIELDSKNQQNIVIKRILAEPKKDFIGYLITMLSQEGVHIWQAYINPEYRNTKLFDVAYEFVENDYKKFNPPKVTFSSNIKGWGDLCKRIGFAEEMTFYTKRLG